MNDEREFKGSLVSGTGVFFEIFMSVLLLARAAFFIFRALPLTPSDLVFPAFILALNGFVFWHVILAPPRLVRLTGESIELRSRLGSKSTRLDEVSGAAPDFVGQAQLLHRGGKDRLGLAGPELQRFLVALRETKPEIAVRGLAAS